MSTAHACATPSPLPLAREAYVETAARVRAELRRIGDALTDHNRASATAPHGWGYVHRLEDVLDRLAEVLPADAPLVGGAETQENGAPDAFADAWEARLISLRRHLAASVWILEQVNIASFGRIAERLAGEFGLPVEAVRLEISSVLTALPGDAASPQEPAVAASGRPSEPFSGTTYTVRRTKDYPHAWRLYSDHGAPANGDDVVTGSLDLAWLKWYAGEIASTSTAAGKPARVLVEQEPPMKRERPGATDKELGRWAVVEFLRYEHTANRFAAILLNRSIGDDALKDCRVVIKGLDSSREALKIIAAIQATTKKDTINPAVCMLGDAGELVALAACSLQETVAQYVAAFSDAPPPANEYAAALAELLRARKVLTPEGPEAAL